MAATTITIHAVVKIDVTLSEADTLSISTIEDADEGERRVVLLALQNSNLPSLPNWTGEIVKFEIPSAEYPSYPAIYHDEDFLTTLHTERLDGAFIF